MDVYARALVIADRMLNESPYRQWRRDRYASFDRGTGAAFEEGEFGLEDLRVHALEHGELAITSAKQELYEQLINQYI